MFKKKSKIQYNHQRAFTLVEAVVALAIFIIGILAILQFLPAATKLALRARHKTQAAFLTQGKMEEYLAKSYLELDTGVVEARAPVVSDTTSQLYYFEVEVEINYVDENLNEITEDQDMKKVEVTTYWDERGQEKQEGLVTLISRY